MRAADNRDGPLWRQTRYHERAMRVTILYFAAARERAGTASEVLEVRDGATAGDALAAACARHPPLQAVAQKLRLAVDREFATAGHALRDGSEVALIPPVSGGAGGHRIGPGVLSPDAPVREVAGADCGAVVTFVGTVRADNHGKRVVRLEYEAYPEMALRELERIGAVAHERWAIHAIAITHRIGRVPIGEVSVAIGVSSSHRQAAFAACQFAIDRLKEVVPIWKKEYFEGGEIWIGSQSGERFSE